MSLEDKIDYYAKIVARELIDDNCNESTMNDVIYVDGFAVAMRDSLWDWLLDELGFDFFDEFKRDQEDMQTLEKSIKQYIQKYYKTLRRLVN